MGNLFTKLFDRCVRQPPGPCGGHEQATCGGGGQQLTREPSALSLPSLFGNREMRVVMLGLDAAGKTTILYKLASKGAWRGALQHGGLDSDLEMLRAWRRHSLGPSAGMTCRHQPQCVVQV